MQLRPDSVPESTMYVSLVGALQKCVVGSSGEVQEMLPRFIPRNREPHPEWKLQRALFKLVRLQHRKRTKRRGSERQF